MILADELFKEIPAIAKSFLPPPLPSNCIAISLTNSPAIIDFFIKSSETPTESVFLSSTSVNKQINPERNLFLTLLLISLRSPADPKFTFAIKISISSMEILFSKIVLISTASISDN